MESLTKYEQETIISFNAGEKTADVYTADPNMIRKLDNLCAKYPEHYKCIKSDDYSKSYEVASKKLVSLRSPRIITEEQKEELVERLNRTRNK